jgi:hypothetical protein
VAQTTVQVMLPAQLKLIIAFTCAISWHAMTVYVGLWVAQGVQFIAGAHIWLDVRVICFL